MAYPTATARPTETTYSTPYNARRAAEACGANPHVVMVVQVGTRYTWRLNPAAFGKR